MGWVWILAGAMFVLACVFACVVDTMTQQARWKPRRDMSRFVSDEEFLAACCVKNPETALRVRSIISDQLDVAANTIHPDDRFVEELRAD